MYFRRYTNYGCNVLRCFPHCCPHNDKRGCGTSISVRLTATSLIDPVRIQAFATCQPCSMPQIQEGNYLPVAMFENRRSSANPGGKWLQGRLDLSSRLPCFHFNADKTEGWHYDWKGGASVMQRLEKHQLCVYVVIAHKSDPSRYKVVASATSSPFLLGSYRRALFPPGKSTATPTLEKPAVLSHAEVHSSSAAILYDMRRFCQSLMISDFPNDWRQFEQVLFREFQAWFNVEISPSELVHSKGKEELFIGDFRGARKATLRLLRWWMSPSTQRAMRNYLRKASAEMPASAVDIVYEKCNKDLAKGLEQVEPRAMKLFLQSRKRMEHDNTRSGDEDLAVFAKMWKSPMQAWVESSGDEHVNGEWLVDLPHSRITFLWSSVSFLCMSQVLTMIFGLRINLTGDILQVQSLIQRVPAGPASFVLDSVPRRMETLLNGEPWTALDPTMIQGDYIGWRENNTHFLWLYGWPKFAGGLCYVLQLQVSNPQEDLIVVECTLETCQFNTPRDFESRTSEERIFRSDTTALEKSMNPVMCYRRRS
ncbi:hypothetical protein Ae201684P_022468 [Aphanomyces euteiches]|nr:hypothetical protein Ae201684P_022468 [Aphanomyces euteiches]